MNWAPYIVQAEDGIWELWKDGELIARFWTRQEAEQWEV